jgi:integrase/recombinase XerD
MAKMQSVRVPHKLPVVLSKDEVTRLLGCVVPHQTPDSAVCGVRHGLRVSEVVALKVTDIDSKRMTLRVEQGKGRKDRYAMLSPVLLERLRVWWRVARAQGKMLEGGWLFPGLDPLQSLGTRQLNRAIHDAAALAQIDKRVSMHTLRHSFRHPLAGAEGGHSRDPGVARAPAAGHHCALRSGGNRPPAGSHQPARETRTPVHQQSEQAA